MNDRCRPRVAEARNWEVAPSPIAHCACGRPTGVKPKPPSAVASRGLTPASRPKHGSGSDSGSDGFTVSWLRAMRTLLGLGEVRIERRLSLQQDTSEAKQSVGDATQRAAMRFAAPA